MLGRSALRADCAAVLGQGAALHNSLRAPAERSAQTGAVSQFTKHACPSAGMHAPCPALLAAPEIALAPLPRPRRVDTSVAIQGFPDDARASTPQAPAPVRAGRRACEAPRSAGRPGRLPAEGQAGFVI